VYAAKRSSGLGSSEQPARNNTLINNKLETKASFFMISS
jgi:hypothetical protein